MASAEKPGGMFANLPAGEQRKFMRQLRFVQTRDERYGIPRLASPKKAVNGFIAFRSYYSILFSGLQQKERSPFLRRLYNADPFHAEWEFVARIYSHLRNDVLKLGKQAPLRVFLATACPVMNMIAADAYFETCGWSLVHVESGNKHPELIRDDGAESRLNGLCKTTPPLNGFDLLLRCLADGYEVHNGHEVLCMMMERQEHLMTKSFSPDTAPSNLDEPLSPNASQTGNFFTWKLTKPSPPQDMDVEDITGHEPGGHLLHFDNIIHQQSSPDEGKLSEPSAQSEVEVSYQLDLPGDMYKFGFGDGDMGMHLGGVARRLGQDGGGGLHPGADEMMGPGVGEFVIHGDFGDPYMNGVLDYGHSDTFGGLHDYERLYTGW